MLKFQFRVIPWVEKCVWWPFVCWHGYWSSNLHLHEEKGVHCLSGQQGSLLLFLSNRGQPAATPFQECGCKMNSVSDSPLNPFTLFKLASCENTMMSNSWPCILKRIRETVQFGKKTASDLFWLTIYSHLSGARMGSDGVRRMDQALFNLLAYYTNSKLSR